MKNQAEATTFSGYQNLMKAVDEDCRVRGGLWKSNMYLTQVEWILERAKHYAEKTGLTDTDILDAWESKRLNWYMNYYSEENQPLIQTDLVRVFNTEEEMYESIGELSFRCHSCNGISTNPSFCNSEQEGSAELCEFNENKLRSMFVEGGTYVFIKEKMKGMTIFTPLSWEN